VRGTHISLRAVRERKFGNVVPVEVSEAQCSLCAFRPTRTQADQITLAADSEGHSRVIDGSAFGQLLCHQAAKHIGWPTRCVRDDHTHRSCGIVCALAMRDIAERGAALAARYGKFATWQFDRSSPIAGKRQPFLDNVIAQFDGTGDIGDNLIADLGKIGGWNYPRNLLAARAGLIMANGWHGGRLNRMGLSIGDNND
jgi:hypothetical protein